MTMGDKNMKYYLKLLLSGILFLGLLIGAVACSGDSVDMMDEGSGKISFSFKQNNIRIMNDAKFILLSIVDENGTDVIMDHKLELISIGSSFVTQPIEIDADRMYRIIKFIVLNDQSEGIFASPLEGSELANMVSMPLPLSFSVGKDQVQKIEPEVVSTGGLTAEDFGYITLSFKIVTQKGVMVSVFAPEDSMGNFIMTDARVIIKVMESNTIIFDKNMGDSTGIIEIRDPHLPHVIEVLKDEYSPFMKELSPQDLAIYMETPLQVFLQKGNGGGGGGGGVDTLPTMAKIAVGNRHTHILKADGTLWGMGNNKNGILGDGTSVNQKLPVKIMDMVKNVFAFKEHSFIITNSMELYITGQSNSMTPEKVAENIRMVAPKTDGFFAIDMKFTLWEYVNGVEPRIITENVRFISSLTDHLLIVKNDNTLWGMGSNGYGQLGAGDITQTITEPIFIMDNVDRVAAGKNYSLVLKHDKTVWGSGSNVQLPLGESVNSSTNNQFVKIFDDGVSILAGENHSFIITSDRSVWASGNNSFAHLGNGKIGANSAFEKIMEDIVTIGSYRMHSLFMKKDGSIMAVGWNDAGQLGDNSFSWRRNPVMVQF